MNTGFKRLWILALLLYAVQAKSGELLGKISDETAPTGLPEQPAANNDRRIIYRVICSPEGELLPECQQPPVNDVFETAQPQHSEPESPAVAEPPNERLEPTNREDQPGEAVEPVAAKKVAAHKKRSNKSVKKRAKKTSKPAQRQRR